MSILFPYGPDDLAEIANQSRRLAVALDGLAAGGPSQAGLVDAPILQDRRLGRRPAPAPVGRVYGHPRIASGRMTVTSEVFAVSPDGFARTWSRFYRLGGPMSAGRGRGR